MDFIVTSPQSHQIQLSLLYSHTHSPVIHCHMKKQCCPLLCARTHTHAQTHTHTLTHIQTHTHTDTHTHTHTYTNKHTHTHPISDTHIIITFCPYNFVHWALCTGTFLNNLHNNYRVRLSKAESCCFPSVRETLPLPLCHCPCWASSASQAPRHPGQQTHHKILGSRSGYW